MSKLATVGIVITVLFVAALITLKTSDQAREALWSALNEEREEEILRAELAEAERRVESLSSDRQDSQSEQAPEARSEAAALPEQATVEPIESDAPFRVSALCVDEAGDPLIGIAMTAMSLDGSPQAYTDATGHVTLEIERGLERIGKPVPAFKSAGAPTAFAFLGPERATRIVYGPGIEELGVHDCGRVVLVPGGNVVGRVVGEGGLPLGNLTVYSASAVPPATEAELQGLRVSGLFWLTMESGGTGTRTDYDGRFRLEGIATGPSCVWAQDERTYAAWTDTISLSAGETRDVGTLELKSLARGDSIEGIVFNVDGSPSGGAVVSSESLANGAIGPHTFGEADANGRFLLPALANVTHRIRAHHVSDPELMVHQDGVLGGTRDVELHFVQPEMSAKGLVAGRVLRAGEPEPDAAIESFLYRDESGVPLAWREHRANGEGKFAFELPDGSMCLLARSADGTWVGVSPRQTVANSTTREEVVIRLQKAASIEGVVLTPPGVEAHGIEFRATGPDGITHKVSSRSNGAFEFEQLPPGAWTVKRISTPVFTAGDNSPDGAQAHELQLEPGEVGLIEVDLRSSAELAGRIAIGEQDYASWFWSLAGTQGKFASDGSFRIPAIAKLGGSRLLFGGRMASWMVQVACEVRLESGLNEWALELATGSVELRGLPLGPEFPFDGSFQPVCTLHYEEDEVIWEAMPFTALDGRRVIENVPAGLVRVLRGGAMSQRLDGVESGAEVLGEFEVRVGETATFDWIE